MKQQIKQPAGAEIRVYLDGDQWCALRGENLQSGDACFGDTPLAALAAWLDIYAEKGADNAH